MMITSRAPINVEEVLQKFVTNIVGTSFGREMIKISTTPKNKHNLGAFENKNDVWVSVNKVDSREYLNKMNSTRQLLDDVAFGYVDTVMSYKSLANIEKRYDAFRMQFKDVYEVVFSEGKVTSIESLYDTATAAFRSGVVAGEIKKMIDVKHGFANVMPRGQQARTWNIEIESGMQRGNLTARTYTKIIQTFERFKVGTASYADDRFLVFFKNDYAHIIEWLKNHMDEETFKLHPSPSNESREPYLANILIKGKENLNFFKLNHYESVELVIPYSTAAEILHTYGIGGKLI